MLEKIKNPFVAGLLMALSVVITDFLNAFVLNPTAPINYSALILAVGIAVFGYIGQFLTGSTNTILALLGSAIVGIVPLLTTGDIDWRLVAAAFLLKFIGLKTDGLKTSKAKLLT